MEPPRYGRLNDGQAAATAKQQEGKRPAGRPPEKKGGTEGSFGRLVMLGCDVATYAPASYRRHRL